jgi:hypothetical protein
MKNNINSHKNNRILRGHASAVDKSGERVVIFSRGKSHSKNAAMAGFTVG